MAADAVVVELHFDGSGQGETSEKVRHTSEPSTNMQAYHYAKSQQNLDEPQVEMEQCIDPLQRSRIRKSGPSIQVCAHGCALCRR